MTLLIILAGYPNINIIINLLEDKKINNIQFYEYVCKY